MTETKEKTKRRLQGVVVSDKMQKTAVVKVTTTKRHPKYKKQYLVSMKYKAHDEKKDYHVGDKVVIEECRPISKDKNWRVIKKVTDNQ